MGVIEEKEKQLLRELQAKYGMQSEATNQSRTSSVILFGNGKEKKRNQKKNEKDESKSVVSKLINRSILKEVKERDWEFTKKDDQHKLYYRCLLCKKENIRKDNRRTHKCIV
jgi:hypothetical protein